MSSNKKQKKREVEKSFVKIEVIKKKQTKSSGKLMKIESID